MIAREFESKYYPNFGPIWETKINSFKRVQSLN